MARTINSPGVQITEKDLSLRQQLPVGTSVLVPGFAPQGPIAESLFITSTSELEAIYGIPTTPAEKYFYYSCKEVLDSPAVLNTMRLPYGTGNGSDFSNAYSGLFYPMTSGTGGWEIQSPTYVTLSPQQYAKIAEGSFEWVDTDSGGISFTGGGADVSGGFFVLNDLQAVNNEIGEGFYIGFADNLSVAADSPNFDSVEKIVSLSSDAGDFSTLATASDLDRIDFALSASKLESDRGITSVSESLEKVGFIGFETAEYQDHLSLGVFKLRKSTVDASLLTLATTEKYLGSFDFNRKKVSPSGGVLQNSFIEDTVNNASPTIKLFVNPAISKEFNWTSNTQLPTSRVTVSNTAKALFPLGIYTPDSISTSTTKAIGNIPGKLDKVLRSIENIENSVIDIIVDAGLSTIYAVTNNFGASDSFDDETYVGPVSGSFIDDWRSVTNEIVNFCENTRKDCMAILDPPRAIFVSGRDQKVIDMDEATFTEDIYKPLREVASYETNYAAMYGNWIKIADTFGGRRMWQPFSAHAAAIFARSDANAYTWSAPAGLTRGTFSNALDIAFNPNQKQRDRLYEISVNPVVFFFGEGFTVMGQKTLQTKPTAFDRINVRRLFLTLERATQRTLKYFVFEPNTEFTRGRLRATITPAFEYAKNTEGLYDYLIVCDDRNNTPDTIDNNELIVDIYLKPVRTAEFILVNFIATRTGQNFAELI